MRGAVLYVRVEVFSQDGVTTGFLAGILAGDHSVLSAQRISQRFDKSRENRDESISFFTKL